MQGNSIFNGSIKFHLRNQTLWLLPQKGIFWQEKKFLIIADLHLGKAGHFRKAGIPVPSAIHRDDLHALDNLIVRLSPSRIFILGDLFHSDYNAEWLDFEHFMHAKPRLVFTLVRGNHDILPEAVYQMDNLEVITEALSLSPFLFTHKPAFALPHIEADAFSAFVENPKGLYNLSGHIHPGVSVRANAVQQLKMPCFYFTKNGGILPAFGKFTGFKCLKKNPKDMVFGIVEIPDANPKVFQVL